MSVSPDTSTLKTAPAPASTGRRLAFGGAGLLAVAALAFGGWKYWTVWQYQISTDDAYVRAHIVTVAPEVSGYIKTVGVGDNQRVRAGDVLAVIDPTPFQSAVHQAEADLAEAVANIQQIKAELAVQPDLIAEARATITVNQAVLRFAQENMQRDGTLANRGFGTLQSKEDATSQLLQADARVALANAALRAAERRVDTLNAELVGAEAKRRQYQALLNKALFNLERTTLRAPIDGVVGNRELRLGMFVQPGSQLLAVVPLHETFVVANYKETNLTNVKPGQPVSIVVDTFPDTPVRGFVESIAPAAGQEFALLPPDNATGNFTKIVQRIPVKIVIDPKDPLAGRLLPGMSVTTTIAIDKDAKIDKGASSAKPAKPSDT